MHSTITLIQPQYERRAGVVCEDLSEFKTLLKEGARTVWRLSAIGGKMCYDCNALRV